MAKDLSICLLLDFYGALLTDKQREVINYYYNEDLSLAEIAEHTGITRQGVRDSIKRGEAILLETEAQLGFARRLGGARRSLAEIRKALELINRYNQRIRSSELAGALATIDRAAASLAGMEQEPQEKL